MAISSIERRSSILQIRLHSWGVSETEVVAARVVKMGTRRVEGIFLESSCDSAMRRGGRQVGGEGARAGRGALLGDPLPLVDAAGRLHQQVGVRLLDGGLAGLRP